MPDRPNILMFLTDQQSLDAIGCYGASVCRTPNIDRLASQGMRFARHYTACPLCSPARASILTGREVHGHGVTTNVHELGCNVSEIPDSADLLSRKLGAAGYHCGYTGKWHLGNGQTQGRGGVALSPATATTRGFMGQDTPQNRGGWNFPDFKQYLCDLGLDQEVARYENGDYGAKQGGLPVVDHPLEGTCEYFLAQNTIHLIDRFRGQDGPFFIWHNTWGPHGPYICHRQFYELYRDVRIPEPANFRLDPGSEDLPLQLKRGPASLAWEHFEHHKRLYFALTTQIDAMLGRILDHLQTVGLADQTVILFSSDHGSHFGWHGGLGDKGFSHFEESQRTGCVLMDPRAAALGRFGADGLATGSTCQAFTSLLDLYPTLLELAGAAPNPAADGRSLLPLLRQEAGPWRDYAFVEFYGLGHAVSTMLTLRCGDLKYGWNATNRDELYDLRCDPGETRNRVGDPGYAADLHRLRERLYEHLVEHGHPCARMFRSVALRGDG